MKPYKTVLVRAEDEFIINKSRFIGHAVPCQTEEQALAFIAEMRQRYKDASHNCYAYVLGQNKGIMRYSDDGEPGGTAGLPMMEVLKNRDVTDLCVVVTRYFGGILLGAGGLVRAYTQGAVVALNAAHVAVMHPSQTYLLEIDYSQLGRLEHWIKDTPYRLDDREFAAAVTCQITLKAEQADDFTAEIARLFDGRYEPMLIEERFMAWEEGEQPAQE